MGHLQSASDEELLAWSLEDPAAFGAFYRRHAEAVLSFLVRRSGSAQAGTELTAEVFAAALQHVRSYRPDRAEPVAWLYGIAHNKLADFHRTGAVQARARRRMGFERIVVDDQELDRVERLASLDVTPAALADALDDLPGDQRRAVVARVVLEKSYPQISEESNVTTAVARQRVSRGLAALRQRLGSR